MMSYKKKIYFGLCLLCTYIDRYTLLMQKNRDIDKYILSMYKYNVMVNHHTATVYIISPPIHIQLIINYNIITII